MAKSRKQNESMVYGILRMSQKALMLILILIGIGYLGSMIAIIADPSLAEPLSGFSQVFIPLFQLEIGVYGLGSTVENVQKIKQQIDDFNKNDEDKEKDKKAEDQTSTDNNG